MGPAEQVADHVSHLAHQAAVGVVDPDELVDRHLPSLRRVAMLRN